MSFLILVTDAARARFFEAEKRVSPLAEIEDDVHFESQQSGKDRDTDAPGRSFESHAAGKHSLEPHTNARDKEAVVFARELAASLEEKLTSGFGGGAYLIAAPDFLGLLRKQLSDTTKAKVILEIDKDLTKHSVEDIRGHLPKFL